MPRRLACLVILFLVVVLPLRGADKPSDTQRGDRLLDGYFRQQVKRIADADLADIKTRADWEKKRPELRRQFLDMLGLWPLPPRTDLHTTITGKVETDRFTVEKLHFQSSPGLYVTANLYVPKHAKLPAPTILYVCGHANVVQNKVSYGSKVFYQRYGAWFAEHGYVCLILDTLELGEIPGEHHGTYRRGMWWWQALGYTPAGIECWNGMRALDYLQTRKEVDARRIGVTGRSGGGATSWWIAAADDRSQCLVPVAGIADLYAHVIEGEAPRYRDGVISGHCDCMYFVNMYRWDFGRVMALCAPRSLLLGNSDADDIFPVAGYRRLADKVRRIYELYGAADRFQLMETKGPHQDTPELRLGTFRWMNRWLKDDRSEIRDDEPAKLTPQQLKVFDRLPADAINATIHESFFKAAKIELPQAPAVAREWWKGRAPELRKELRTRVFRNWPDKPLLNGAWAYFAGEVQHKGLRLRAYDFVSEDQVSLRLWLMMPEKNDKPTRVVVHVLDEKDWQEWVSNFSPAFQEILQLTKEPKCGTDRSAPHTKVQPSDGAFAAVTPRGIGPTRWSEVSSFDGKPNGNQIRRRFALLGQTLDGQRVWDVRRAVACLRTVADLKGVPLWLQGKNDMAGIALYASLFESDVARLDLWHPPASHRQAPIFLNVLRVLDMPQAVALAFPRKVRLYVKDDAEAKAWSWPVQLQQAMGQEYLQIRQIGE